jgi:cytochrome c oxidase subunit III
MPTFSPPVEKPRTGLGGRGNDPGDRYPGGGGDGGRGDPNPDYGELLRRYRLGMAIGLVAIFVLFLTFSVTFVIRQKVGSWDIATQSHVRDWTSIPLPMNLLLLNTFLLLLSSYSLEKCRRQAFQEAAVAGAARIPGIKIQEHRTVPWLAITLALGSSFLVGQAFAWREIMRRGFFLSGNPNSSFFYTMTGMHGVHLIGGTLALAYAAALVGMRSHVLERRRIVLDVTAWYWHSMTILWIYILALLKFVE